MGEPEGYYEGQQRRDRIKVGLEALTLLAIIVYASLTACLLKTGLAQLESSSRPIIAVGDYSLKYQDQAHKPETYPVVFLDNFGHSPTKVHIRKAAICTDKPLFSGPDLTQQEETLVIPPGHLANRIDYEKIASLNFVGYCYLAGLVEYKTYTAGYHTRFCLEFPQPNTLPNDVAKLCQDPKTNDIN
jgi:hypothetical protein